MVAREKSGYSVATKLLATLFSVLVLGRARRPSN